MGLTPSRRIRRCLSFSLFFFLSRARSETITSKYHLSGGPAEAVSGAGAGAAAAHTAAPASSPSSPGSPPGPPTRDTIQLRKRRGWGTPRRGNLGKRFPHTSESPHHWPQPSPSSFYSSASPTSLLLQGFFSRQTYTPICHLTRHDDRDPPTLTFPSCVRVHEDTRKLLNYRYTVGRTYRCTPRKTHGCDEHVKKYERTSVLQDLKNVVSD